MHARLLCCCSDTIFLLVWFLKWIKDHSLFPEKSPSRFQFFKKSIFENTSWTTSVQTEKCHSAGSRENIYEGALSSQYSLRADTIFLHPQGRILWIERGFSPWEKAQEGGGMNGTLLHSANCSNSRTTAQFHNLSPSTPLFYFSFKADKTSAGLSK